MTLQLPVWGWILFSWVGNFILAVPYLLIVRFLFKLSWVPVVIAALLLYIPPIVLFSGWCNRAAGLALSISPRELGFSWPADHETSKMRAIDCVVGFLLPTMAYLVVWALSLAVGWSELVPLQQVNVGGAAIGLITGALLPAVTEEAMFRGFMLMVLLRNANKRTGLRLFFYACIDAMAFSLIHVPQQLVINPAGTFQVILLARIALWWFFGLILFYYAIFSGHLWGVCVYHLTMDWLGTAMDALIVHTIPTYYNMDFLFILAAHTCALGAILIMYRHRRRADPDMLIRNGGTYEDAISSVALIDGVVGDGAEYVRHE